MVWNAVTLIGVTLLIQKTNSLHNKPDFSPAFFVLKKAAEIWMPPLVLGILLVIIPEFCKYKYYNHE